MTNFPDIRDDNDFVQHFHSEIWLTVAENICQRHCIAHRTLRRAESGEHIVFLVDDSLIIKIYRRLRNCFERERTALNFVRGKTNLPVPEIQFEGEIEQFNYLVLTQQTGVSMYQNEWLKLDTRNQIRIVAQLGDGLRRLHSHRSDAVDFCWHNFIEYQSAATLERQKSANVNRRILERLPDYLAENLVLLPEDFPRVFLHGDVHFGNLRFAATNGNWRISGLFDFADSLSAGFHEFDFVAIGVLMIQGQGDLQRELFRAYGYADGDINETLRRRLMLLTILYECSDLRKYALRLRPEAVDYTLDELERAIWNFV